MGLLLGANLIRFPWTVILDILQILLTSRTEFQKSHGRTGLGILNKIFPVLGIFPLDGGLDILQILLMSCTEFQKGNEKPGLGV
jgi:hypothetical protein